MRTQEEIVEQIKLRSPHDVFGFEWPYYLMYLDYERAKPFLKENTNPGEWKRKPLDKEAIFKQLEDYMSFAWDKAKNCRGISANLSISHFIAWIWLMGDDEFYQTVLNEYENNYEYYGKDILCKICEHYHIDNTWDDGIRTNSG